MIKPRYLLDSNVCIRLLQGQSEPARQRVERCVPGELVTSSIAYAEVLRGLRPDDVVGRQAVQALFRMCVVMPFEETAAQACQRVPFRRASFDRLIGAHALALGLTVVTDNEHDFADIPGLDVENWTAPL